MNCLLCNMELVKRNEQILQCPFVFSFNENDYNHFIISKDHFSVYNKKFALAYIISLQKLLVKDIMYAREPSELLYNITVDINTAYNICRLSDEEMLQKLKLYQTFS